MYERSKIMTRAGELYRAVRDERERCAVGKGFIPRRSADALHGAWSEAKKAAARARTGEPHAFSERPAQQSYAVRSAIAARLREMRCDTEGGLTRENWKELGALRNSLRAEPAATA